MALAASSGLMVVTFKDNSKMELCTEEATMCGKMAESMRVTTDLTRNMAKEPIRTQTVASTAASGSMACSMVSDASSMPIQLMKRKAFGLSESSSNG